MNSKTTASRRAVRFAATLSLAASAFSSVARADEPYQTVIPEPSHDGTMLRPGTGYAVGSTFPSGAPATEIGDLVDGRPGVNVQRTNRGAASPIVRGFIGIENLLTLDGVRLNLSTWRTGPNQYAALFDPLMLDAIGVELGPSGIRHGAGALGGVIAMSTHEFALGGADRMGLHAVLGGAFADTSGVAHVRGAYGVDDFDGWAAATVRGAGDLRAGGGGAMLPGAFTSTHWGTRNRLKLSPSLRLQLAWFGTVLNGAKRTDQLARGTMREADNADQVAYARLEYKDVSGDPGVIESAHVTLSYRSMHEDERQARCERDDAGAAADLAGCGAFESTTVQSTNRWRDGVTAIAMDGSATSSLLDRRLAIELLGGLRREWIASDRPGQPDALPQFSDGSTYDGAHAGLWLTGDLARASVERDTWAVRFDGGLRLESMRAFAPDVPGLGEVDVAFTGLGAGLRAVASYDDFIAFHGGWTRGFRAPNLQEATVLGDTGQTFEIPNANLRPQRADSLEFGLRIRSRGAVPAATLEVTAFSTIIRDAIVRVPATFNGASEVDGKEVGQRVNADRGRFRGAELSGRLADRGRYGGLAFDWSVSFIDGSVTTRDGVTDVARRLPPINGRAGLAYTALNERWKVGAQVRWSAPQRRLASGDRSDLRICADPDAPWSLAADCQGTDAWVDVGLWASVRVWDALDASLQLDNLLDRRYRVHGSGVDAPGFNARLALRWTL